MRIYLSGLGDSPCPSAEQLQGIVDINDPCQSSVLSTMSPGYSSAVSTLNSGVQAPAPPSLFGLSSSNLFALAAGMVGIALLMRK